MYIWELMNSVTLEMVWGLELCEVREGPIDCGITYCIRNEEVVSQQSVVQQRGNDALQAHQAPV